MHLRYANYSQTPEYNSIRRINGYSNGDAVRRPYNSQTGGRRT